MSQHLVDVNIAVHSQSRPIARAVASVIHHNSSAILVNVVAHNIDPGLIRQNLGTLAGDPRVRILPFSDGIHSPSGPFNHGFDQSTAPFVAIMGSDDELAPGAIDSWVGLQKETSAAMVIARIRMAGGGTVASPPARPLRRRNLDAVKDRLAYRSAPLGLISRERFGELRFPEGLASGEDLPYVLSLWFSAASIAFDRTGPAYIVHEDAADRVTFTPRPIMQDFAFLDHVFGSPEFERLDAKQRTALTIKLLRTHVFDAILNRAEVKVWPEGERESLKEVTGAILDWGNHPERMLSRLDRALLDAILVIDSPLPGMVELARRRSQYATLPAIAPRNPLLTFHRQAPLRTLAAGYLLQRS